MKKIFIFCLTIIFVQATEFLNAQTKITFYTTMGNFEAVMYDTINPITSGNFIGLVNSKFYDGITFHRVIDNFMIQGGDPTGTGNGGSGTIIPDEFDSQASNVQKAIGMANSGPNTGTSQFFINLVNNTYLNPDYPVFGKVITNFSVVQAIGNVATDGTDRPLVDVIMDSLRVTYAYVGITEFANDFASITVFPNPVTESCIISINASDEKAVSLSVYSQQGILIHNQQQILLKGINNISLKEIQKSNFSQGIYCIIVTDGKSISQKKFVLLR